MIRLHLVNLEPQANLAHWANVYSAFGRAAQCCDRGRCMLTNDPAEADAILFCGNVGRSWWPIRIWQNPVYRAWPRKAVRFSTSDHEVPWLPGLYTSLTQASAAPGLEGGCFPYVAFSPSVPDAPPLVSRAGGDTPWLYTFVGSVANHPVRAALARNCDDEGLFLDTFRHPGTRAGADPADYIAFRRQYAESLAASHYVLCPRGAGPSSIRIFEVMRAARVPVIISDAWVPPAGMAWDSFSFRVAERDLACIPGLLRERKGEWKDMACRARQAWETHFSSGHLLPHVATRAVACLGQANRSGLLLNGAMGAVCGMAACVVRRRSGQVCT